MAKNIHKGDFLKVDLRQLMGDEPFRNYWKFSL